MKKVFTLLILLAAILLIPLQLSAMTLFTSQSDGSADPNDYQKEFLDKETGDVTTTITPNTQYYRIYKYKKNNSNPSNDLVDNDENIPDPELRYYLAKHFGYAITSDNQKRMYITVAEATAVTELDLSYTKYSRVDPNNNKPKYIADLLGLQIFRHLKKLNISGQIGNIGSGSTWRSLASGYVPAFVYNNAVYNDLNLPRTEMAKALPSNQYGAGFSEARRHYISWFLQFFPEMEEFNCSNTEIEYIHIENYPVGNSYVGDTYEINGQRYKKRPFKKLICSNCPYLYSVKANYTELADLDVTGCPYLVTLEVHHANLTSINVEDNTRLATLDLEYNGISTIIRNTTPVEHERIYFDEGGSSGPGYYTDYGVVKKGIYPFLEVLNIRNNNLQQEALTNLNQCPSLRLLKCQYNHLTALDFHDDAALEGVWCNNNQITSLEFDANDVNLHTLECQNNQLTSLDLSGGKLPNIRFLDCSGNPNLASLKFDTGDDDHPYLHTVYAYKCGLTDESNLNFSALSGLKKLRLSDNTLSTIDLSNNTSVEDIYVNRCGMSSITGFDKLTKLQTFMANENFFSEATMSFAGKSALITCELTGNNFRTLDFTGCNALKTLKCNRQGLQYDKNGAEIKVGEGRILSVLKVASSALTTLECQNNALLTLDLSACPNLTASGFSSWAQRTTQDLIVVDNSKVLLPLPNGINSDVIASGIGKYFHTWSNENSSSGFDINCGSIVNADGSAYVLPDDAANTPYLVVYDIARSDEHKSALADVNFYDNTLKYIYYTFFDGDGNPYLDDALGKSQANGNPDDNIEVKCYPYIMYINPASQDVHSKNDESLGEDKQFYSGTLILEYDAIVPAGATAYIAKNVQLGKDVYYSSVNGGATKVTANQLRLVEIEPGEGATNVVIPANTPIYVKADDASGLYGFHRAEHPDYLVGGNVQPYGVAADGSDLIKDNILQGTLVPLAVSRGSVLTLGRSRIMGETELGDVTPESRIGFWPFNGTTVPAHRVYIPATAVDNAVTESSSRGLLFSFFDDDENAGTVTGLSSVSTQFGQGWYTVSGIRLEGRPTQKGVYIHNGKKEVIR